MATTSARLGLRKPADADDADVDLDINPLVQHIDDNVPSKAAALVAGATGSAAALRTDTTSTLAGNRAQSYRKQGETNDAHSVDFDGKHQWGSGGNTALDTNLYRAAADKLKTDDAFEVAGALTALSNLTVSGTGSNLSVGGSGSVAGALAVGGAITGPGVKPKIYTGTWLGAGGANVTMGTGGTYVSIYSVSIPSPGYAYCLKLNAGFPVSFGGSSARYGYITFVVGSETGTALYTFDVGYQTESWTAFQIPSVTDLTSRTGATTVWVRGTSNVGSTAAVNIRNWCQVEVLPAP
ncbi:hypothetical protein [Amycolatopsis albispora]|uniref:Uncharacterized protein n=1 Tax=Amycolatopsis albispora TaxID=1804986 RepID=A0A344LGZ4_9PSEU|nr:hypothetical protein [Amycolatopsis albispora]AXB47318.1 hypothetical protein A4R43_36735 [Amycolatopsis albispora]